jgi:hypothetical protein
MAVIHHGTWGTTGAKTKFTVHFMVKSQGNPKEMFSRHEATVEAWCPSGACLEARETHRNIYFWNIHVYEGQKRVG